MSKPYNTSFDNTHSPISSPHPSLSPSSTGYNFQTNIHRNKTKRWVTAPRPDYGGGWGDDDEYDDDEYEEEDPGSSGPQKAYTAPPGATGLGLHRSNSFDRGDDGAVHASAARMSNKAPGAAAAQLPQALPPTPAELEQQEREMLRRPAQPVQSKSMPHVPTIQLPSASGQAQIPSPIRTQHRVVSLGNEKPLPSMSTSPEQSGFSDRVPPQLVMPERVPPQLEEKPLPLPKHTPTNERPDPFGGKVSGDRQRSGSFGNTNKPTPPLPPPEDRTLATISEKSSMQSSPSSPSHAKQIPSPKKMPTYDDYEGYGYGDEEFGSPPSQPGLYFPSQQKQHEHAMQRSQTEPVQSPTSPPRVIRPQDIYKKHQEEMQRRASEDSSRPSIDSARRPSASSEAERGRQPEDLSQRLRSDSARGRSQSNGPARTEPQIRPRSTSRGAIPPALTAGLAPASSLPTVPGSPAYPTDGQRPESTWGDDILAGYTTDDTPDQPEPTHSGTSEPSPARNDSSASTGSNGQRIRNMVDGAFCREETPQTPSSEVSRSMTEDISPIMSRKASQQKGYFPSVPEEAGERNGSETAASAEHPLVAGITVRSPSPIKASTPPSASEQSSPEKDELDVFLGELERANTPTSSRSGGPAGSPGTEKRVSGRLDVQAPPSPGDSRKSMGVYSLYDSYWQDDDDLNAPPPIQPKSPRRTSGPLEPLKGQSEVPAQPSVSPPPQKQKTPPLAPVAVPTSTGQPVESVPQTPVDSELLDMMTTTSQFLNRSGTDLSTHEALSIYPPDAVLRVKGDEQQRQDVQSPQAPSTADSLTPTEPAAKHDEVKNVPASSPIGPDSEGMEVLHGPTNVPPRADGEKTPAESEFAKELVNQFSRPQTLMLKDTMPMPTGMQVMPPMPPLPHLKSDHPEVVNFEESEDEGKKKVLALSERASSELRPKPELDADDAHKELTEVSPVPTPAPPEEEIHAAQGAQSMRDGDSVESDNRLPRQLQPQQDEQDTKPGAPAHNVFKDTRAITGLATVEERVNAYNATREYIANEDTGLQDWLRWQLEHNGGHELLATQIVRARSKSDAGGLKKSRSRMGIGGLGGAVVHGGVDAGEVAKENLERVGKGAMKLGEKTGARVGGWMKRVGRKGHANKESKSENGTFGYGDGAGVDGNGNGNGITGNESGSGMYPDKGHGQSMASLASSNTHYTNTTHRSSSPSRTQTPTPPVPVTNQGPASSPEASNQSQRRPSLSRAGDSLPRLTLPKLETSSLGNIFGLGLTKDKDKEKDKTSAVSGEETRQTTPAQYYASPSTAAPNLPPIQVSQPLEQDSTPTQLSFPARTDSLSASQNASMGNRNFPGRTAGGDADVSLPLMRPETGTTIRTVTSTITTDRSVSTTLESEPRHADDDDDDLYAMPKPRSPAVAKPGGLEEPDREQPSPQSQASAAHPLPLPGGMSPVQAHSYLSSASSASSSHADMQLPPPHLSIFPPHPSVSPHSAQQPRSNLQRAPSPPTPSPNADQQALQPPQSPPQSPPSIRRAAGIMKTLSSLSSTARGKRSRSPLSPKSQASPPPPVPPLPQPPEKDKDMKDKDKDPKDKRRGSFLNSLQKGVNRSASVTDTAGTVTESIKTPKRGSGSLLAKFGGDRKGSSNASGSQVGGDGSGKSHRKGFSIEMFGRSTSLGGKIAKAGQPFSVTSSADHNRSVSNPPPSSSHGHSNSLAAKMSRIGQPFSMPSSQGHQRGLHPPRSPQPGPSQGPLPIPSPALTPQGYPQEKRAPQYPDGEESDRKIYNATTGQYESYNAYAQRQLYPSSMHSPLPSTQGYQYPQYPPQQQQHGYAPRVGQYGAGVDEPVYQQSPPQRSPQGPPQGYDRYAQLPPLPPNAHTPAQEKQNGFHGGAYYGPSQYRADPHSHSAASPTPAAPSIPSLPTIATEERSTSSSSDTPIASPPAAPAANGNAEPRSASPPSAPPPPPATASPGSGSPLRPAVSHDRDPSEEQTGTGEEELVEDKIALHTENPESEAPQVVASSLAGYEGIDLGLDEDEDIAPKMSATAYPGQAWEPAYYAY